jgi:hypothetical protein
MITTLGDNMEESIQEAREHLLHAYVSLLKAVYPLQQRHQYQIAKLVMNSADVIAQQRMVLELLTRVEDKVKK